MNGLIASIATGGNVKHLYHLSTGCVIKPGTVPITLPVELQIQILSLLEWDEVLLARQTCKRLRDASLARPVWVALVKWYYATVFPRPFCLEKPLELYTDRELEHLVLRWQKSSHCWALDKYKTVSVRQQFASPDKAGNCVHLVEGGRWLLVGSKSGSVLYYDLDAPSIEPSMLIPTPFDEETAFVEYEFSDATEILLSVDMDVETEYLKFNLGIMTRRMPCTHPDPSQGSQYFRWIQVWRVNADVDTDGSVKGLRAERLACFPEQHRNRCRSIRLHGQNFAYTIETKYEHVVDSRDRHCIIVVDWTFSNSCSLVYPRRVVWRILAEWLALLPGNLLLSHYRRDFFLFNVDDASKTTLDPSQYNLYLTRLNPVAELVLFADAISEPYFLDQCTRISVLTRHGASGLVIPHSNSSSRGVIEFITLHSANALNSQIASIGYDRAFIFCGSELTTLQFTWPEDSPCQLLAERVLDLRSFDGPGRGWPKVHFDESSGRILISVNGTKEEVVLGIDS